MTAAKEKKHGGACSDPVSRADLAASMHIVRMADARYHVVSIPGFDGELIHAWPGHWATEAAARLFREDLLDACAEGSPADAYCSSGIFEHFHCAGRILEIIERHEGDKRALANALASMLSKPAAEEAVDDGIPF
jgi:hypothetical protein